MTIRWHPRRLAPLLALVALLGAGCTSYQLLRQAEQAESAQDWDRAVARYIDLSQRDPGNVRWRSALLRARMRAAQEHFTVGRRYLDAGSPERALVEYERAVQLDPTNQYAQVERDKVRDQLDAAAKSIQSAPTIDELKARTRNATAQPPVLNPRSRTPISLDFPQPQSLFAIYRALGKAFGINILFDPQLRDQDMAIELRDVTAQTALETLMRTAGHFYKVIDEQTILIAQDNQQNRRTYEDLVIQTFYLSNAEVKDAVQLLRSLISSRNLAANEQLNAVTIRDTADKVKIAQKLIETIDKARSEVVVDIELLQVNTTKLLELGVSLSANQVTQTLDLGKDVPVRISDLNHLTQNSWALTVPSILYDFLKSNSDAQLLAKPQIRITEGEKAKVRIGDQVPLPTTTFSTSNTVGGSVVPITSFTYKDIGINIDLEPRVHHNKEITLKLLIEVSQITGFQDAGGGQKQPIIGNRTIESTIRLKDGETNFLAGLIRTDETNGDVGIPGLSDIPVLGKIFGKSSVDLRRTDIMMTITPHIVRTADVTEQDLLPIWVGTEANMTFRGGTPQVESGEPGPFEPGAAGAPAAPEKPDNAPAAPPTGVNLSPTAPPSSPFTPPAAPTEVEPPAPPPADAGTAAADSGGGTPFSTVPTSSPATQGGGVQLALQPSVVSVEPGDVFQLAMTVDARTPVAHLPATLSFDPRVLAVDSVVAGDFLGGPGTAQVLADTSSPGSIVIGASRLGRAAGVAGSGTVATISFRALAAGSTPVHFAARRVLDPSLVEVGGVTAADATIEVRAGATAPPSQ